MLVILMLSAFAFAQEKSAFERMLSENQNVQTHEGWREIDGRRYRVVEVDGKFYFLRFLESGQAELNCTLNPSSLRPPKVDAEFSVFNRTRLFVQLLKEKCVSGPGGRDRVVMELDPRIGFTLPEDAKSKIKNKKVYLMPAQGLGFSGEFE